jgi:hypothetical protein
MTIRILFVLCILNCKCFSQTNAANDSLINEICKTLIKNTAVTDSIKISLIVSEHVTPYLTKFDKSKVREIADNIFLRGQRQCKDLGELVSRLTPKKGDWERLNEKPESKLSKDLCSNFLIFKKYTYLESNGDTVNLTIDNGFWIDNFKNGTFSKLKLRWLNSCEFEIEFISSNNELRKKFSKPGDKYKYQILGKLENCYLMAVEIVGSNQFLSFKLYY